MKRRVTVSLTLEEDRLRLSGTFFSNLLARLVFFSPAEDAAATRSGVRPFYLLVSKRRHP